MRFLQLFLRSLYYGFISCSDFKPGYAPDSAVELHVPWTLEADITEHSAIHPTGVFSGIHLRKYPASMHVANNNCIGDVSRDRTDPVPHVSRDAGCG